jgi:transcriptional regulator with XRE-family HTH domain
MRDMVHEPRVGANPHLGRVLRQLRQDRELTLTRLSELSGLSVPFLSQLENNRANASASSLDAIAAALGCTVEEIAQESQGAHRVELTMRRAEEGPLVVVSAPHSQIDAAEHSCDTGQGPPQVRHPHDCLLYVVRGAIELRFVVDGKPTNETLGAGEAVSCTAGVAFSWIATVDQTVVLSARPGDSWTLRRT